MRLHSLTLCSISRHDAGFTDMTLSSHDRLYFPARVVTRDMRSTIKPHKPGVVWLTGLSAAGKSTIANIVEFELNRMGAHTIMLDGDHLRFGLNKDLGFEAADRSENVRRVGEVAKLMTEAGLLAICALISPFRAERHWIRQQFAPGEFIEIFVDTPLETCIERDPKGLYRRALRGEIPNFTGIDQVYEAPLDPELHLLTLEGSAEWLAAQVVDRVRPLFLREEK
jgi:adenylyl-sulfate kinase